ncbi:MAG TPA: aminomethyl-transferring glycine dehydrogenase subunit GcvPB [Elusimicrobiota bacterium]|nr:aminomethyl-transferring glycine dehydrogenase subunit GcvPB [Elusimicrobiota bacterium]
MTLSSGDSKIIEPLLFEKSVPDRQGFTWPELDVPASAPLPSNLRRRQAPDWPELAELQVVRHFTRLSQLNYSLDTHFYPLGSCTMKYNPKANERAASWPEFAELHPLRPDHLSQGILEILFNLEKWLGDICGMDAVTLQPSAGAQGELTGILVARAYHESRGQNRHVVLIPDSAHGTNPASVAVAGLTAVTVKSTADGCLDIDDLKSKLSSDVAVLMMTVPNTLGLFEPKILEIARLVHDSGALFYMDGANLNALVGLVKPGDLGFDIIHVNVHKTFSTPHGGGGPGAGPVGVKKFLADFLPIPRISLKDGLYSLSEESPKTIGRVRSFQGNTGILIRAYCYLRLQGAQGLASISENAILAANYVRVTLAPLFPKMPVTPCMHEVVVSGDGAYGPGVKTLDVAKRLLDYGFYAPTIYFPLIVPEALMIEPTETETRETLDLFCETIRTILDESRRDPSLLKNAPTTTPVRRLDEVKAAREPNLRHTRGETSPR